MNEKIEYEDIPIQGISVITEDACLVNFNDEKVWIPRSCISYRDDKELNTLIEDKEKTTLRIVRWFAVKKGML